MVSCHYTCHRFSLYTLLLAQSILVQMGKKLFLVQDGKLRALVTGRSLCRLALFRTTFCSHIRLCSSLSQFKTSLKTFLFTSANSELSRALDAVLDLILILLLTSSLAD